MLEKQYVVQSRDVIKESAKRVFFELHPAIAHKDARIDPLYDIYNGDLSGFIMALLASCFVYDIKSADTAILVNARLQLTNEGVIGEQ